MERPSLRRDPKRRPSGHSRWLVRHPKKMQNRAERRRILRELRHRMQREAFGRRWRARSGSCHSGSKKGTGNGAFGGRTKEARLAKIKQTCPERRKR